MAESQKKIVLRSSDGDLFEVEESVALESTLIKNIIEEDCADDTIPVKNVTSKILAIVIEYCKKHVDAAATKAVAGTGNEKEVDADLEAFDAKFVNVDQPILFEIILAANYLDIKGLLDLTCQAVADSIKDKTPKEIREIFNIENDFSLEEEDAIVRENPWAFA